MGEEPAALRRSIGIVFSDGGLFALTAVRARRLRDARRRAGRGDPLRPRRGPGRGLRDPALDRVRPRRRAAAGDASSSGPTRRARRRCAARGTPDQLQRRAPPRPRAPRSPSSAGRWRGGRASATTRSSAPMTEAAPRIEVVISDFGGVLTTPLLQSFIAFQDETGISHRDARQGDGRGHRGQRREPAVRDGARRDQPRTPSSRSSPTASSRCSGTDPRCTASKRSTSRRCNRTPEMIDLMRELKAGRLPDGDADQQRARVGAATGARCSRSTRSSRRSSTPASSAAASPNRGSTS